VSGDEFVQPGDALHAFRQSRDGQFPAVVILDLDIVVVFGPVISDQQQQILLVTWIAWFGSLRQARRAA
jgi:hypothetical protein